MNARIALFLAALTLLGGCGGGESRQEPPAESGRRPTVFDPLTSTIDRAEGVQQTIDEQAAEQRKRIEAAER